MRDHIEQALEATGGRIEGPCGAAARLDVNPHTLRARMRKLGIRWRDFRASGTRAAVATASVPPGDSVAFEDVMRLHIETALRATHGRIEGTRGAAARLAVNPHTLRARMRRLGIDWRQYRLDRAALIVPAACSIAVPTGERLDRLNGHVQPFDIEAGSPLILPGAR